MGTAAVSKNADVYAQLSSGNGDATVGVFVPKVKHCVAVGR